MAQPGRTTSLPASTSPRSGHRKSSAQHDGTQLIPQMFAGHEEHKAVVPMTDSSNTRRQIRYIPRVRDSPQFKPPDNRSSMRYVPRVRDSIHCKTPNTRSPTCYAPHVRDGPTAASPLQAARSMTLVPSTRQAPRVASDLTAMPSVSAPALSAPSTRSQKCDATRLGSATRAMPPTFASSFVPRFPCPTSPSHSGPHDDSNTTAIPLAAVLEQLLCPSPALVSAHSAAKPLSHALAAAFQAAASHPASSAHVHFEDPAQQMTSGSAHVAMLNTALPPDPRPDLRYVVDTFLLHLRSIKIICMPLCAQTRREIRMDPPLT